MTVPPEYVPANVVDPLLRHYRLSKVSAWRYEKRAWLKTHLIANRRYILAADVADFNKKLASHEFAGSVSNPSRHTLGRTKQGD